MKRRLMPPIRRRPRRHHRLDPELESMIANVNRAAQLARELEVELGPAIRRFSKSPSRKTMQLLAQRMLAMRRELHELRDRTKVIGGVSADVLTQMQLTPTLAQRLRKIGAAAALVATAVAVGVWTYKKGSAPGYSMALW